MNKEQPPPQTMEDYILMWRQWRLDHGHRKQTVIATSNSALEVARFCGRHRSPISDFTTEDIQYYVSKKTIKYSTISLNTRCLSKFFRWAVSQGYADTNPLADYKVNPDVMVPSQLASRTKRFFTPQQVSQLMDYAASNDKYPREWFYIIWIGYETGARIGDMVKLSKEYFDLDTNTIMIRLSKTDELFQTGEISQDLMDALMELPSWNERYLFPVLQELYTNQKNPNVRPSSYVYLQFKALCKSAKVPDLGVHALRKTFASLNYAALQHITTIQRQLGHKDPDTTGRYISNYKKQIGDKIIDFNKANAEFLNTKAKAVSDSYTDRETR